MARTIASLEKAEEKAGLEAEEAWIAVRRAVATVNDSLNGEPEAQLDAAGELVAAAKRHVEAVYAHNEAQYALDERN